MKKQTELSLEIAKRMYHSGDDALKQFAINNFSEEELKGIYVPDWVDCIYNKNGYFIDHDCDIVKTSGIYPYPIDKKKNRFISEKAAKGAIIKAQLDWVVAEMNKDEEKINWVDSKQKKYFPSCYHSKDGVFLKGGLFITCDHGSLFLSPFAFLNKEKCELFISKYYDMLIEYFEGL